jgi:electron-transferring-flavoprotein dehydrogenase
MNTFVHHSRLSAPTEREALDVDVLFVGGGPASLSGALWLSKLVQAHNEAASSTGATRLEPMIALIEKAAEIGAHALSGAVLNPIALGELVPDYKERGCPIESSVSDDSMYFLTGSRALRIPYVPAYMSNHGNEIVSLAKLNRWLGGLVEAAGVNVFPGFAGTDVLESGTYVTGALDRQAATGFRDRRQRDLRSARGPRADRPRHAHAGLPLPS